MRQRIFQTTLILFLVLSPTISRANTLLLKNGKTVSGDVVEAVDISRPNGYVKLKNELGVEITYYADEIYTLDGEPLVAPTPAVVTKVQSRAGTNTKVVSENDSGHYFGLEGSQDRFREVLTNTITSDTIQKTVAETKKALKSSIVEVKENIDHVSQVLPDDVRYATEKITGHTFDLYGKVKDYFSDYLHDSLKLTITVIFFLGLYMSLCYPLMILAKRLNIKMWWAMWIPLINIYLLTRMADRSIFLSIFFFFPVFNMIVFMYLTYCILDLFQKPSWMKFSMYLPFWNIVVLWQVALEKS